MFVQWMPCSGSLDWTVVRLATWRRYILAKVELKNFPVTVYLCVCAHVHVYCSLCTYISEYFSWSPYHVPVWSALSSEGTGTCCVVLCCVVLCCVVLCTCSLLPYVCVVLLLHCRRRLREPWNVIRISLQGQSLHLGASRSYPLFISTTRR